MEEHYYKAKEVAKTLNVSVMTIYRLIETGQLKAVQVSKTYRIPASAVDAYLDANATT